MAILKSITIRTKLFGGFGVVALLVVMALIGVIHFIYIHR